MVGEWRSRAEDMDRGVFTTSCRVSCSMLSKIGFLAVVVSTLGQRGVPWYSALAPKHMDSRNVKEEI
ncbi:hypothetical protein KC19_9G009700 [Ceratodon purpureus]|uniref:Uncharacterized protein n=1 Tax=Ceratodon purpureus TaxID=3225 RepID=A0A8T0GMG9_CERPU|nr:hypothetical protein KC19_9G009700 [Ceratodon purpureus]